MSLFQMRALLGNILCFGAVTLLSKDSLRQNLAQVCGATSVWQMTDY